jgi:putative endonuclease
MKIGYVYILKSLKSDRYYIGSTDNPHRRFRQHNSGNVSATRYIRPLELRLVQEYPTLLTARKIEQKLKKLKRKDYIRRILDDGKIKMGL